jgi:hypothetical protein
LDELAQVFCIVCRWPLLVPKEAAEKVAVDGDSWICSNQDRHYSTTFRL